MRLCKAIWPHCLCPVSFPRRDILFVALIGLAPLALLLASLLAHELASIAGLASLAVAYLALIAVPRFVLTLGGRLSAMIGVLLCAG
jgi:hypothetical protein